MAALGPMLQQIPNINIRMHEIFMHSSTLNAQEVKK
jgi:hypothetical protein